MSTVAESFDADILSRVIMPDQPSLSPEAAQGILAISFPLADRERMDQLAEKARQGALSEREREEVEAYERIGSLLGLMQSKARLSLKRYGSS